MLQSTLISVLLFPFGGGIQETEAQSVQQYRICGLNYTHVIDNCRSNPTCPSGDDCPIGYTCYQLNEALCPSIQPTAEPTPVPTPAPTPGTPPPTPAPTASYNVCAGSFIDARNACQDPTKACTTCNNVTEACFTILESQCIDPTTESPSAAPIIEITQSPSMTAIPTKAPTFNNFFCAPSWEVADEECDSLTPCPNGQQDCFDPEMNCYEIQAERCAKNVGSPEEGGEEEDVSGVQLDEPASSSSGVVTTETEGSGVSNVQFGEPASTIVVTETSGTSGVQVEAPSPSIPATGSSVTDSSGTSGVQVGAPSPSIPVTGSSVTESSGTSGVQVEAPSPSIPDSGSSVTESSGTSGVQLDNPSTSSQTVSVPPSTPVVTFGTKAPIPSPVFNVGGPVRVCGRDAFEAATNCNFDPNRPCPNFPCGPGEICFELDSCNTGAIFTAPPTVATESPTPGPSGLGFIWTTPAPNASNKPSFGVLLKSVFAVAIGAALTVF